MIDFYASILADEIKAELVYGEENSDIIAGEKTLTCYSTIHNARKHKHIPQLEHTGFCIAAENSGFNDFTNQDKIIELYYPIIRETLKKQLENSYHIKNCKIYLFNNYLRNESSTDLVSISNRAPALIVHADYSPKSLEDFFTDRIGHLFKNFCGNPKEIIGNKNWGFFNVWKPLNLIINSTLALCDKSSLIQEDIYRNTNYIKTNEVSHIMSLNYRKTHRWFYYPLMQPNEVIIFEQYKSDLGFNEFIPAFHSAFKIDKSLYGYAPRQSIEIRGLSVWE